jgi:hypothetical protein
MSLNHSHSNTVTGKKLKAVVLQHVKADQASPIGVCDKKKLLPFTGLPLLAVFVLPSKKAGKIVAGQKTSNRGYVLLEDLSHQRSKKDMLVAPVDTITSLVRYSDISAYSLKIESAQDKIRRAETDVNKATATLEKRRKKLEKVSAPKAVQTAL